MEESNTKATKNKKRRILFFVLIVMISIMLLYIIMDNLFMPVYTRHWQSVNVPEVTFKSFRAAKKILQQKGLNGLILDEKFDGNYPPGYVLFQNPLPNSAVKKGRRIYLTVGKGNKIIQMPDLIGISERDAKFTIEQYQLELIKIYFVNDIHYPLGVVCEQSIPAGEDIEVGSSIELGISIGQEEFSYIVPSLIGKSKEEAMENIEKSGLILGQILYQETDKILPNTVIRQSLTSGQKVNRNDSLNIVLSKLPGK
ncbi:PASTA domain-containing protein [candidate division KSB1 bacterium]|nr:PASTA domain-containing protein [candidate division KSB1 bacterium]